MQREVAIGGIGERREGSADRSREGGRREGERRGKRCRWAGKEVKKKEAGMEREGRDAEEVTGEKG